MRRKGKVHPSPSSSSSSSCSSVSLPSPTQKDVLSVLKLLPAAILAIITVLSLEDREVLAYMITRSIKSTNPSSCIQETSNKSFKRSPFYSSSVHKTPFFDCECFDCYTGYWFKWDSSPNRELIHQAIEAYEEHLYKGEQSRKCKNKKKDKMGRRGNGKRLELEAENLSPEFQENRGFVELTSPESVFSPPKSADLVSERVESVELISETPSLNEVASPELSPETSVGKVVGGGANNHKGLARKVLPDVLGLLNSRLWNLWGPNV